VSQRSQEGYEAALLRVRVAMQQLSECAGLKGADSPETIERRSALKSRLEELRAAARDGRAPPQDAEAG
jgi:hypothetical protein